MTLIPAYGRDYTSKKAVLADFLADKDFLIADVHEPYYMKPVNRNQILQLNIRRVTIRYKRLRNLVVITL